MYRHIIKVEDVKKGMKIADAIYVITDTGANMMLIKENTLITDKIIALLKRQDIKILAVYSRKPPSDHTPHINEHDEFDDPVIESIIGDELREEAVTSIQTLFKIVNDPETDGTGNMTTAFQAIKNLDRVLNQLVAAVTAEPIGVVHIYDLKSYDEYTYHHSLSVALLSMAIGNAMGFSLKEIVRLSRCAVLHDVGKLTIPIEILHKRGKLTANEYKIVQSHAAQGFLNLKNKAYGDTELWNGVMFHHEKINGEGYPKGLAGNEIPLFSRIISVADVYDAVTSYRPYRDPLTPSDAYELIMSQVGTSFDHEIVSAFLMRLTLYPVNASLILSDGRSCYVKENENGLRPVVVIKDSGELLDLNSYKNMNITILQVVNLNGTISGMGNLA